MIGHAVRFNTGCPLYCAQFSCSNIRINALREFWLFFFTTHNFRDMIKFPLFFHFPPFIPFSSPVLKSVIFHPRIFLNSIFTPMKFNIYHHDVTVPKDTIYMLMYIRYTINQSINQSINDNNSTRVAPDTELAGYPADFLDRQSLWYIFCCNFICKLILFLI